MASDALPQATHSGGHLDGTGHAPAQPVYFLPSTYLTNVAIAVSSFDSPYLPNCYRVDLDSPYAPLGLQGEDSLTLETLAALRGELDNEDDDRTDEGGRGDERAGDVECGGRGGAVGRSSADASAPGGAAARNRSRRDGHGSAVTWRSPPTARERAIAARLFPSRPWADVPAAVAAAAATAVEIEARRERLYGAAAASPPRPAPTARQPAPSTARRRPVWR